MKKYFFTFLICLPFIVHCMEEKQPEKITEDDFIEISKKTNPKDIAQRIKAIKKRFATLQEEANNSTTDEEWKDFKNKITQFSIDFDVLHEDFNALEETEKNENLSLLFLILSVQKNTLLKMLKLQ